MILSTKLYPPPPASSQVSRARLIERLMRGLSRPFTLVSAPAGFGKSTLLAEWASVLEQDARAGRENGYHLGWLSLDAQENALGQFWKYFAAAWRSALPAGAAAPAPLLDQLHKLLEADEKSIAELAPGQIINLMLEEPVPVLIVLDDYHQIHNPEIHASLAQLIERLPAHARLAVAARSDPPLPIPRLRVREQVTEIRAANLRFTGAEIAALFARIPGVKFSAEDIAAIEASTEGWAAGLKMALLALQSQERSPEETRQFWASFTGRNVYILDYLTEEVLGHLPQATQEFLVKTALLDRLTDGLCAAVVDGSRNAVSAAAAADARAILEQLERANLFLIPLDQERRWFRYHHLFADLLRVRLQQQYAEQIPLLHQRAAAWYEEAGWVDEAMQHSIAAKDWQRAARLVEAHSNAYLDRGQLATVLKWVEALPPELLRRRPNLCVQMIWALAHAGKTHLIGPLLKEADAALADWKAQQAGGPEALPFDPPLQMTEQDAVRVQTSLAVIRAYGAILAARPDAALQLAESTLAAFPEAEPRERAWLNWVIGYAQRGLGNIEQAIQSFIKAVSIGRESGTVWEDHSTDLGIAYRLSGRLEDAARVFEDALRAGELAGLRNKGNLSRVEAYLSAVRMEQNRVDEAMLHARKGVEYLQWWPSHNHIATAYGFYGLALLSTGALAEAEQAVERSDQEHRKGQVTPFVTRLVETARVKLWLARGDGTALKTWVEAQPPLAEEASPAAPVSEYEEMHRIVRSRAVIGLARMQKSPDGVPYLQQAARLLAALSASAQASRRVHAGIEIHLLGALARWELAKCGQSSSLDALEWLARSLAPGLPGGYRRIYLEEGRPAAEMLQALLERDRHWLTASGVDAESARDLLAEFNLPEEMTGQGSPAALAEPLTEREKDVLHLLAAGLSNRAMAEKLVLSEGTIKTHVHNLIGKLGAESRTQVIARARELGLL